MICSSDKGSNHEQVALETCLKVIFVRMPRVRPNVIVIDKSWTSCVAIMANKDQTTSAVMEPVPPATLQKEAPETEAQQVVSTTPKKDAEREKEISTLMEELAAHEALRERERAQK